MPYDIRTVGKAAEVRLRGRLTFAQHRSFRKVVNQLECAAPQQVVLDLSDVEYIDAAGLGLLLVAREAVSDAGGLMELRGVDGPVGRMLRIARVGDLFPAA